MPKKSQKRASRALTLISVGMLALISAMTALFAGMKTPNAIHEETGVLPSCNLEALLAALALTVLAMAAYASFGRPHKGVSEDEPRSYAPDGGEPGPDALDPNEPGPDAFDANLHPAVFGRLCRWNRKSSRDLTATVLRLVQIGAIRMEPCKRIDARGRQVGDYRLTLEGDYQPILGGGDISQLPNTQPTATEATAKAATLNPIDSATLKLLFGIVGKGTPSLTCADIHSFGRHHADAFSSAIRSWQTAVSAEVRRSAIFDRASEILHYALMGLSGTAVLTGLLLSLATHHILPTAIFLVPAAAFFLVARQMPRHTPLGVDAYESAQVLHHQLQASSQNCDKPANASLIPYAYVLHKLHTLYSTHPGMQEFCTELAICIESTAFASESLVAQQSLRALNSPVRGAMLDHGGVTGLSDPREDPDSESLFCRRA